MTRPNPFFISILFIFYFSTLQADFLSSDNFLFAPLTGSGCSPMMSCPADVTITGDIHDTYLTGVPLATPAAGSECGTPAVYYLDEYQENECGTYVNRVWYASSFNSSTFANDINICQQNILVNPPCELICPPNQCVTSGTSIDPSVLGFASGDDCTLIDLSYEDNTSSICDGASQISRVWFGRFQGYSSCEYTCVQTVTIGDNAAPVISNCPADIVVDSNCDEVYWEEPTALDNCVNTSMSSNYLPGQCDYPMGATMVEYSAVDGCGNVSTCSFTIFVQNDRTYNECPDDITIEVTKDCYAYPEWDAPIFDSTCNECPPADPIPGLMRYGSYNGSDYYISKGTYSRSDAEKIARRKGGYLVSINSAAENDYLTSLLRSQSVHIGLSDVAKEGSFVWADGTPLTYTNWFLNQPNNQFGNQDYVELLKDGTWNDTQDKQLCFIMERPCEFVKQVKGPQSGAKLKAGVHTVKYVIENGCGEYYCCSFDIHVNEMQHRIVQDELEATEDPQLSLSNLELDNEENAIDDEENAVEIEDNTVEIVTNVYPNPFRNYLWVELEDPSNLYAIEIFNQNGQMVLSKNSNFSQNERLDMGLYARGVYIMVLTNNDGIRTVKKVIKD